MLGLSLIWQAVQGIWKLGQRVAWASENSRQTCLMSQHFLIDTFRKEHNALWGIVTMIMPSASYFALDYFCSEEHHGGIAPVAIKNALSQKKMVWLCGAVAVFTTSTAFSEWRSLARDTNVLILVVIRNVSTLKTYWWAKEVTYLRLCPWMGLLEHDDTNKSSADLNIPFFKTSISKVKIVLKVSNICFLQLFKILEIGLQIYSLKQAWYFANLLSSGQYAGSPWKRYQWTYMYLLLENWSYQ